MIQIERNRKTEHQFTAFIDYYLTFPSYLGSYKRSFDILLQDTVRTGNHVDHIAYPLLFLARHCMELGFKTNIRYFFKYSEIDDYIKAGTHDLEKLFNAFKLHVQKTFENLKRKYNIEVEKADKKSFSELCDEVGKLNDIFHQLDKTLMLLDIQ